MLKCFQDNGDGGIKGLTEESIRNMPWCEQCASCKSTRKGHLRLGKARKRSEVINGVIHTDTMERQIKSAPPHSNRKAQCFVDEATRWVWVGYFDSKTHEVFSRMLEEMEDTIQMQQRGSKQWTAGPGQPILVYHTDKGVQDDPWHGLRE